MAAETAAARGRLTRRPRRDRGGDRARSTLRARHGYAFVGAYLVLLIAFGVLPTGYAIYLALTNSTGQLVGLGNFTAVAHDFRFAPAFEHIDQRPAVIGYVNPVAHLQAVAIDGDRAIFEGI